MAVPQSETTLCSLVSPVQLGKTDQVLGTIFRKQIMSYGTWVNPNWWDEDIFMELKEEHADKAIENFNAKVYGKRISVPLNHTGDVTANAGQVIKLEKGVGGLWAYLDIRRPEVVEDIENGLVFDVSMGFDWDYQDQKDGKKHGFVLAHVALVTDPYLNDMDDFQRTDTANLSRRYESWAENVGFGKSQPSMILMSKHNVEELKRMKFAKVTNDKEFSVDVTYTDAEGKEVTATVEPAAELEVPAEAEEAVKSQVADSTAPAADPADPTDDPADPADPADPPAPGDDPVENPTPADPKDADANELSRLRAEKAEWEAEREYQALLAKGKIVPAQKDLFLSLCQAGAQSQITLSAEVKSLKLAKDQTLSVPMMLSAVLSAGPKLIQFGEKGGEGEKEVKLTKEQEEKLTRMGFSVDKFKKHLAAGTITLEEIE